MDVDNVISVNRDIDTVLNDVDQEIYSEDWNDYSRDQIKDEIRRRGISSIGSDYSREIRFKETAV